MDQKYKNFLEKLRILMSDISLKTYLYAILAIGVLVFVLILSKGTSKYGYKLKEGDNRPCYDIDGNLISAPGKYCLDILGTAKDYGLDFYNNENPDYTNDPNNNLTLDMSQDLVLTNIYLKQNGITDPQQRGEILANVIKNYQASAQGKIYTEKDLDSSRGEDLDSISNYYLDIANILNTYVSEYKENKSSSELIDLNNTTIEKLLNTPSTKDGGKYQINIINTISSQNNYLDSINSLYIDPMRYLVSGGDNYSSIFRKKLSSEIDDLNNYFIKIKAIKN